MNLTRFRQNSQSVSQSSKGSGSIRPNVPTKPYRASVGGTKTKPHTSSQFSAVSFGELVSWSSSRGVVWCIRPSSSPPQMTQEKVLCSMDTRNLGLMTAPSSSSTTTIPDYQFSFYQDRERGRYMYIRTRGHKPECHSYLVLRSVHPYL